MAFRVAAAQLSHETNVFSSVPTDMEAFSRSGIRTGTEILRAEQDTNSAFGGFATGAAREALELLPIVSVWATPSGIVPRETFNALLGTLLSGIRDAGAVDGVLLALHGAMVAEHELDADGAILEAVRETIGWDVPLVVTLDLHGNISERMVFFADVLIGYDTYPHVDMAARADEACTVLARLIRGEIAPATALVKPPMLPTSQRMTTDNDPMRTLIARAHAFERDPRVINVTISGGFPPADVPEAGFSVVVTTDNDAGLAEDLAGALGDLAWSLRDGFLGGVTTFDDAANHIGRHTAGSPGRPVVVVDIGDNPWTGGPGDSVELLRFLLEHRIPNAAVALVVDPEAVRQCVSAGVGASLALDLGGKTDRLHGDSLNCTARVRMVSDGRFVNDGPMMEGVSVDLGLSAVVEIGHPSVAVLITSRGETPIDLQVFLRHGIDPRACNVIALKGKGHFRAAFEPIAAEVVLVEGPGITGADLSRLPFHHVRRPIWPLDDGVMWP